MSKSTEITAVHDTMLDMRDRYVQGMRNDYNAPVDTRYNRRRTGLGGSGDSHYSSEHLFFKNIEQIRDEERNGFILPRLLDLACEQEIGVGPTLDPDTGDKDVDKRIKEKHEERAADKTKCDVQGRMNFLDQTYFVRRSVLRDGDICANMIDDKGGSRDGTVELLEADRLRSPTWAYKSSRIGKCVHGVEIDKFRKPIRYWFTGDPGMTRNIRVSDMNSIDAIDDDGNPNLLHVYNIDRVTQMRGVSPFTRVFSLIGMGGDIEFANLVKQQTVSFFAMGIRKKGMAGFPTDGQYSTTEKNPDGTTFDRLIQQVGPGMMIQLHDGEELQGFSPNVPGDSFFQHMRLILQEICVTLGLSLVQVLLDASETNFSGYRGATDSSRKQCKHNRKRVTEQQWLTPVHLWHMRRLVDSDSILRNAYKRLGDAIFRHKWKWPGWDYIEPSKDANADKTKRENLLSPLSQIYGDRGLEVDDVRAAIIRDNSAFIRDAINEAKLIYEETGVPVDWKDLLFLSPKHDPNSFYVRQSKQLPGGANSGAQTNG